MSKEQLPIPGGRNEQSALPALQARQTELQATVDQLQGLATADETATAALKKARRLSLNEKIMKLEVFAYRSSIKGAIVLGILGGIERLLLGTSQGAEAMVASGVSLTLSSLFLPWSKKRLRAETRTLEQKIETTHEASLRATNDYFQAALAASGRLVEAQPLVQPALPAPRETRTVILPQKIRRRSIPRS